ncbi:MAG: helix-turn-helix domain-containing protein [Alloprevotella sp.]
MIAQELSHILPLSCRLDDDMLLWPLSGEAINAGHITPIASKAILLVGEGRLVVDVEGRCLQMTRGCYADLSAHQGRFGLRSASANLRGYLFLFTSRYVVRLFRNRPPFGAAYVGHIKSHPVCLLPADTLDVLTSVFDSMMHSLNDKTNIHRSEIVRAKTFVMYMEIAHYFEGRLFVGTGGETTFSDRGLELLTRFVDLLHVHARRHHSVTFYAERLSVTPQYLSRMVRLVSGCTASEMIGEAVIGEAKAMLEDRGCQVSDVASRLHFADSAVFSKFFKRHTGLSPLQYRGLDHHH